MSLDFKAAGSPPVIARAIEDYARSQGHVSAIVVPWESSAATLCMAVTAVTGDGWAIEHTNLGTITLTDFGPDATRVAVTAAAPDRSEQQQLAALFDRFARQLQRRFEAAP